MNADVTAVISTKGRYDTTLPLTILGIAEQIIKPREVVIYDDNETFTDLRPHPLYSHLFPMLLNAGINYRHVMGGRKGQVHNHERSLKEVETRYIWRLDDDNFPEPNVLRELINCWDSDTAAAGCNVWFSNGWIRDLPGYVKNSFKTRLSFLPMEWYRHKDRSIKDYAEHLNSTFLYDREIASKVGYCKELSIVGHREETIFTHSLFRLGYKLKITPKAVVRHFHSPIGGIRSYSDSKMWEDDEKVFERIRTQEWGYHWEDDDLAVLKCGLGDHIVFRMALPEIMKKHPNLIIACTMPQVFEDMDVSWIPMHEAEQYYGDLTERSIYSWLVKNNWKGYYKDAFVEAYK